MRLCVRRPDSFSVRGDTPHPQTCKVTARMGSRLSNNLERTLYQTTYGMPYLHLRLAKEYSNQQKPQASWRMVV